MNAVGKFNFKGGKLIMKEKSLMLKDLVNIGVFSAIYTIISFIAMLPSMVSPIVWLLWPATCGVLCSFVYILLVAKIPKKGRAFLISLITGIIYFAMGECTWTIILSFSIAGVIAEIIRYVLGYQTTKSALISSGIIAVGFIGSPLPMWLFQDSYVKSIIEMGMDIGYVEKMQNMISIGSLFGVVAIAFLGGLIGGLIGKALFKKHFEKAGII